MPDFDLGLQELPKGLKGLDDLPRRQETLVNLFFNGEGIIRRHGIKTAVDSLDADIVGEGICRGAAKFTNPSTLLTELYQVSGTAFIRIALDGTKTIFPLAIPGNNRVIFAKTVDFLVFITVGGSTAFYFDGTTLTANTTVPLGGYRDIEVAENRFLYVLFNGSAIELSDNTTGGTNNPDDIVDVFNAEDLPDLNTGIFNNNGDIFIGGTDSFQLFRFNPIEGISIPFTKVDRATDNTGYVSGKVRYQATFAFLGQPAGESYGFFVKGQGASTEISNDAVANILAQEYSRNELEACVGYRVIQDNKEIIYFNLARHTFGFLQGNWFLAQSGVVAQELTANWRAAYPIFIYDRYFVGDHQDSRIGTLDPVFKEYDGTDITDNLIEWKIRTFVIYGINAEVELESIELDCLVGTGQIDLTVQPEEIIGTIGLVLSQDGVVFERDNEMTRSLGAAGKYRRRVNFTGSGGMGTYEIMTGIELRGTAPVNFSLSALKLGNFQ